MSKNVWLYTEKEKNIGFYYSMDDGWYYYVDIGKMNTSLTTGIAIIWIVIFRYLCDLRFETSTWVLISIAVNFLMFVYLRWKGKTEGKKYHKYYPDRDQFTNNLAAIKKTYFNQIIGSVVFSTVAVVSIFCWAKYSNKFLWLTFEVTAIICLYFIMVLDGLAFKRKIIKQIECEEI